MACIKTGAKVLFKDYGKIVNCDVYKTGNCYIVRTYPDQLHNGPFMTQNIPLDYVMAASVDAFWRIDLGVFVTSGTHFAKA